jgi:hypothetical protein
VGDGAGGPTTEIVKEDERLNMLESRAVMVTTVSPIVVGVPEITPVVESRVKPAGNVVLLKTTLVQKDPVVGASIVDATLRSKTLSNAAIVGLRLIRVTVGGVERYRKSPKTATPTGLVRPETAPTSVNGLDRNSTLVPPF